MHKKSVQHYTKRIFFCLFLLLWISERSIAHLQNESSEDLKESSFEKNDTSHLENSDLSEEGHALKSMLHNQLEHVSRHAEQVKDENIESGHASTRLNGDDGEDNSVQHDENGEDYGDGNGDGDREHEYDPWQESFQDIYEDGTYVFGHSLPNGVTRFERSYYSEKYKGRVVEGFYTQPRFNGQRILYELRCYRADYYSGYKALGVQYLRRQPIVRRDEEPDVNCFR